MIIRGNSYRTVRYCLECAALLYPDLIVVGVSKIKSDKNLKQTRKALNQQRYLTTKASKFRKIPSSSAEEFLWTLLRGSQLGVSFQRQKVLHGFIVDFWCPSIKLAIEPDGQHHLSRRQKDRARDQFLNDHGVRVLRFIIAEHACLKYSGRIGRSQAAKSFDEDAVRLAVVAHIRHAETEYDELMMREYERWEARDEVKLVVEQILERWRKHC